MSDYEVRTIRSKLGTRADTEAKEKVIEGYFVLFDDETELFENAFERIDKGAFKELSDIRALINHNSDLVIGRTKVGTLILKPDEKGLWGRILINDNDTDACNIYERVKRGDVDQCSFGFEIIKEDEEWAEDGSVHWVLKEVRLFEVSICTFPAYSGTSVSARSNQMQKGIDIKNKQRQKKLKERLKNGIKTDYVRKED